EHHPLGDLGEQGEVRPRPVEHGAEGLRIAGPGFHAGAFRARLLHRNPSPVSCKANRPPSTAACAPSSRRSGRRAAPEPIPARAAGRLCAITAAAWPEIDAGADPVKRIVGDLFTVSADLVSDGHDALGGALLYRSPSAPDWREVRLRDAGNDRWEADVPLDE